MVHHAAVRWTVRQYASVWPGNHLWAMPVVPETHDGRHNDIDGQHVTEADALAAMDSAAAGPVAEGNVGGGNGMRCYQFKGGTGTSSRAIDTMPSRTRAGRPVQFAVDSRLKHRGTSSRTSKTCDVDGRALTAMARSTTIPYYK